MGILRHVVDGTTHTLSARQLIGRSRACELRLNDAAVSGEHASVRWDGQGWSVRDLGSRNGTRVQGELIRPGTSVRLQAGHELVFGTREHTWVLESDSEPVARAVPLSGGEPVVAEDDLLALPDDENPELVLFARGDGSWRAEGEDGHVPVVDLSTVEVAGVRYRLHLPEPVAATATTELAPIRLPDVRLAFRVSRHEEHVEVDVIGARRTISLPARVHLYPLLVLARARLEDADQPEAEAGWVDREELCRMLRTDRGHLNMLFHRCRKQLARAGVVNPGALIQRRARATELRLGVHDVSVAAIGTG